MVNLSVIDQFLGYSEVNARDCVHA